MKGGRIYLLTQVSFVMLRSLTLCDYIGFNFHLTQCKTLAVDCYRTTVEVPYVPNFLAFREVPAYVAAVRAFEAHHSLLAPDVLMVDSNGTLHPLRFGAACHLGVLLERPTFGVAKNLPLLESSPNCFPLDADGPTQKHLLLQVWSSLW